MKETKTLQETVDEIDELDQQDARLFAFVLLILCASAAIIVGAILVFGGYWS